MTTIKRDFIEKNRRRLIKLRDHYTKVITRPSQNASSFEESEFSSFKQSLATSNGIRSQILERLPEIERALLKINKGTYGVCERTGNFIGYKRLKAVPWARYSISR